MCRVVDLVGSTHTGAHSELFTFLYRKIPIISAPPPPKKKYIIIITGAHHPEHPTPMCSCNGVFTSWVIFRSISLSRENEFFRLRPHQVYKFSEMERRPSSFRPEWILVPLFPSRLFVFHQSNPLLTQNQISHNTMRSNYMLWHIIVRISSLQS